MDHGGNICIKLRKTVEKRSGEERKWKGIVDERRRKEYTNIIWKFKQEKEDAIMARKMKRNERG